MNPLAIEIWLYVLAAYMLVSFTLFVMARFSPYEWNNPHPCLAESDMVENQFSVSNSFWFITGTFLRQGSGLNPKVHSVRCSAIGLHTSMVFFVRKRSRKPRDSPDLAREAIPSDDGARSLIPSLPSFTRQPHLPVRARAHKSIISPERRQT